MARVVVAGGVARAALTTELPDTTSSRITLPGGRRFAFSQQIEIVRTEIAYLRENATWQEPNPGIPDVILGVGLEG